MTEEKLNEKNESWPFDQHAQTAALTTVQVIEMNYPILQVVHYGDDHSWAFLCGTTDESDDYRLVHMDEIFERDSSLSTIASLPPGWIAWRTSVHSPWEKELEDGE